MLEIWDLYQKQNDLCTFTENFRLNLEPKKKNKKLSDPVEILVPIWDSSIITLNAKLCNLEAKLGRNRSWLQPFSQIQTQNQDFTGHTLQNIWKLSCFNNLPNFADSCKRIGNFTASASLVAFKEFDRSVHFEVGPKWHLSIKKLYWNHCSH